MTSRFALSLLACMIATGIATDASAATSRSAWVVTQIYNDNQPYAATDSADLATRMALMSTNIYDFYRGTDDIFYQDMKTLPASAYATTQTGYTWLGGDTHLDNFGAQRDSSGNAVFSVDDFDEGYLGQYVWDLRRLATSMVLAGQANGISNADITKAIDKMVDSYVDKMKKFEDKNDEMSYRLTNSNTSGVVNDVISSANGGSRSSLLAKYTTIAGSTRKFQNLPDDLVAVSPTTYSNIASAITSYVDTIPSSKRYATSFYTVMDVHQKLGSGVGSLGKLRYYVLIEGPSANTSDEVILELKQEAPSVVTEVDNGRLPTEDYLNNQGNRVVMTNAAQVLDADVLVGYTTIAGAPYYVHEKSPYQQDFDETKLTSSGKLETAADYFGKALASAHAVSDKNYNPGIVPYSIDQQVTAAVTSKSGLEDEINTFAFDYTAQVNLDWQSFVAAYKKGTPLY